MQFHTNDAWNDSINIHFSKANLHAQALENVESPVEACFGTNGYISPRWYAAKDNDIPVTIRLFMQLGHYGKWEIKD